MLDETLGEHADAQLRAADDVGPVPGRDVRDVHRAHARPSTVKRSVPELTHAVMRRVRRKAHRAWISLRIRVSALDPLLKRRDVRRSSPERFVRAAYQIILRRPGDPAGVRNYVEHLRNGTLTPAGVLDEMLTSMELRQNVPYRNRLRSLHLSRCDFVRMLPRASRILDLGGTDQDNATGSLVSMGYPYDFESLIIVDLPHDDRHDLYTHSERRRARAITARAGRVPVSLDGRPVGVRGRDASTSSSAARASSTSREAEAHTMLAEVRRVLAPGGWFCLDTPNRRATAVDLGDDFSNPDHKIEYTDAQLAQMLVDAGFTIEARYGLSYVGESLAKGEFDPEEVARNHGVYADIDACYLLAYICRVGPRAGKDTAANKSKRSAVTFLEGHSSRTPAE